MTWAVLSSGLTTLAAIMYNLVADVVGGVEVVLLEENVVPVLVAAAPSESPAVAPFSEHAGPAGPDQPTMLVETD